MTEGPRITGPWGEDRIEDHLRSTVIPLRLATSGRTGPTVQSLWFTWADGRLWCATQQDALVVQRLRADPQCGFEVARDEPPYAGVRGIGEVELIDDRGAEVLRTLIQRYLGGGSPDLARWLLSRADNETALAIRPRRLSSWDFSARMDG